MQPSDSALRLHHLSRRFGPVVALSDVSLDIRPGRVHALLGENGAGKSTTVKLLSGLMPPTTGHIEVFGEQVNLASPLKAQALGIQTAFQEMTMLPDLSVLDNMLLPRAAIHASGMIRRAQLRRLILAHMAELEFEVDLDEPVRNLSLTVQQKIEITRAIFRKPRILLLDEPTSTLSSVDVQWLGGIIARLKAQGLTIIFISHRMKEVREFCDDLSILRNGTLISSGIVSDYTDDEVVELIAGRSVHNVFPPRESHDKGPCVLELQGLSAGSIQNASLQLHQGEILGIAALQGMGQLDLFEACFGLRLPESGQMLIDGKATLQLGPMDAIRHAGIGFVPEDRKTEGLLLNQSGLKNASLPILRQLARGGAIRQSAEVAGAARVFERINLDQRALWMDAGSFSGGNQQKIVLARWLLARSRILLLFDPTRGIDVGTKHEIYKLMLDYTRLGGAVLFYSTEIAEVINLSHRIHVIYRSHITRTFEASDITEHAVVSTMLGQPHTETELTHV
ncbi:sugar ABC transporter ATP-binding protein [Castellaniella sp.]|uniref:sugar ABC transporter ATP-binding protein n=1 Tax=Castellaniella sp. TaxID=1955812 RepID=UPI003564A472